jgi:hypothetical protein
MNSRVLRIVLAVVGAALVALGLFHTAADILGSFHSAGFSTSAQSFTLMLRVHWVVAVLAGAFLCVLSLFIGKKKV